MHVLNMNPRYGLIQRCIYPKQLSLSKNALKIIHPLLFYEGVLSATGLGTLESRRHHACLSFVDKMICDDQIGINRLASIFCKTPRDNDHNCDLLLLLLLLRVKGVYAKNVNESS